ncbi:AAA family ATPase [Carnobacterium maltaromaticum]|uniref:AAA family ATPase n=1 Tax=Carnobacterium maltaromaticum TaxID=2751 RepID=UPI00295EE30B|nr:AAA family ATPase [Carnobacterium maltaromaticum]
MEFYVNERIINEETIFPLIVLSKDSWNDLGYVTGFSLKFFNNHDEYLKVKYHYLGFLKIGKMGMYHDDKFSYQKYVENTELPKDSFKRLSNEYFSLGQDVSYYSNIAKNFDRHGREEILTALRDVSFCEDAFDVAIKEIVFSRALLRNLSQHTVLNEFKNVAHDIVGIPSEYQLELELKNEINKTPYVINVKPNSLPNTNLHALIGRNGVGKSFFFKSLITKLATYSDNESQSFFLSVKGTEDISSIMAIDFSVFDSTMPKKDIPADPFRSKLRYTFIGFPFKSQYKQNEDSEIKKKFEDLDIFKNDRPIENELIMEFLYLSVLIQKKETHLSMLISVISIVESDPMFKDNKVHEWFLNESEELEKDRLKKFYQLSSGHKICLLMLLEMVINIENNSLVLIDEPELHLHPPLLSSLIKAINYLLVLKNAVGIVATHSPVVLQEISSNCVWIMERKKREVKIKRPKMNTFGANLNDITREVFKLEVENSGYEKLIKEVMEESTSIEEVFNKFDGHLSENAKLLIASTWGDC